MREKEADYVPEPGAYEVKSRIVEGPTYSIGEKRMEKIEQTVGPGEYEVVEEKAKGVTIGERLREKEADYIPEPGAYEVRSKIVEGPQYSIYEKREQKIEPTVGPGEYEVKEEKAKGVTIGERLREKEADYVPEPGAYEIKSRIIEGPTYSIGEKRIEKIEQIVGPGEYEVKEERK